MAGPIMFLISRGGDDKDPIAIPFISAFEAQTQIAALEAQAIGMDKMLVLTASFDDIPEPPAPEEDKADE